MVSPISWVAPRSVSGGEWSGFLPPEQGDVGSARLQGGLRFGIYRHPDGENYARRQGKEMRALRVVGITEENGELSVVLEDPGRRERFVVAADEQLRAAARGDLARLGQIAIELESQLRPREIQARIRAGASVEQVASAAGVPTSKIERFAYPVLLERSRSAEVAQRAHPMRAEGADSRMLGDVVAHTFGLRGLDYTDTEWDSWKGEDGRWVVALSWRAGRSDNTAHWIFQPGAHGGTVTALDEHATDLVEGLPQRPLRTVGPVIDIARQENETPAAPEEQRIAGRRTADGTESPNGAPTARTAATRAAPRRPAGTAPGRPDRVRSGRTEARTAARAEAAGAGARRGRAGARGRARRRRGGARAAEAHEEGQARHAVVGRGAVGRPRPAVTAPNDYDTFARAYAAHNEGNAFNAGYERPAVLAMVGDVGGKHVLDAGCGAGAHAAELVAQGARVTGLDSSAGLLELAAGRLGPAVPLHRADLAEPLPFTDGAFDVVLASLVLHYLQDWVPTLAEFRRVLVPGGRLVFSTHHPTMDHTLSGRDDYFATYEIVEDWAVGGQSMRVRFWHRPLRAMVAAIAEAGLTLTTLDEPAPDPQVEHSDPRAWHLLTTAPRFLFVVAAA